MTTAHLILDTNILMHFQRIDQIDWPDIADATECILLIAPVVIRELEKHKVQHSSPKLRERAGQMIAYLVDLSEQADPVSLRKGTTLTFIDHEPLLDFAAQRLSREIADDQLIASALEQAEQSGDVRIVSNDAGLGIKLRTRTVGLLRLPESLCLPSVEDAERKEVREMRQQLARLQSRLPKLNVLFPGDATLVQLERIERDLKPLPSRNEVERKMPTMSLPQYDERFGALTRMTAFSLRQEDIDSYNAERERYLRAYEAYLEKHGSWQERVGRIFDLSFVLKNTGSGPATNVDVHFHFPAGVRFLIMDDAPKPPKMPAPPKRPEHRLQQIILGTATDYLGPARISPFLMPDIKGMNDGDPMFDDDSNVLSYAARILKHECDLALEPVLVELPHGKLPAAFPITVTATCNEAPRAEQTLTVKFTA
ncbi:PIN domain-containing protein [Sphingobium sp. AN641]|uniref:PIN domain-containing protein n=1 Tax=Sphingobium sp. AN641 TaxID=3133443 RepID=UPI0030C3465E